MLGTLDQLKTRQIGTSSTKTSKKPNTWGCPRTCIVQCQLSLLQQATLLSEVSAEKAISLIQCMLAPQRVE
eukprot:scaffold203589_cov31-Prasinocladus_malaysianus.AAC.1